MPASMVCRSRSTSRAVLAKTGLRRQTELVSLLAGKVLALRDMR